MALFSANILQSPSLYPSVCVHSFIRPTSSDFISMPLVVEGWNHPTRTENAKVRMLRRRMKYTGSTSTPRLSVFTSFRHLHAVFADDKKNKCMFYGNTLQRDICGSPPCDIIEAAGKLGEAVVKACTELNIQAISSYDRNKCVVDDKLRAFENAICKCKVLASHIPLV